MSSYKVATTTTTSEQPQQSNSQESVEVQSYPVLGSGAHISGQTGSTNYDGSVQVAETRIAPGYSQQGGGVPMITNAYQPTYTQHTTSSTPNPYQSSSIVAARPSSSFQMAGSVSGGISTHAGSTAYHHHTAYPYSTHCHASSGTSYPSTEMMGGGPAITTGQRIIGGGMLRGDQSTPWTSGSRVVTGEEHVIGYNTITGEERIISERVVEHEIKVPKKIVREEVIEKASRMYIKRPNIFLPIHLQTHLSCL